MKPFDSVHFDLWGPSPIASITSVKYFILFVYDHIHVSLGFTC